MATIDLGYVGPDSDARPIYDNDLVWHDGRVWRVRNGDRLVSISGDTTKLLITAGTANCQRLRYSEVRP